jgi:hypothetical protein
MNGLVSAGRYVVSDRKRSKEIAVPEAPILRGGVIRVDLSEGSVVLRSGFP